MRQKRYATMIVDDEPFVREDLKYLLSPYKAVKVEWETGTVAEAAAILSKHHIDLVFLDICLRGGSGFELMPHIRPEKTMVIFVTAHEIFLDEISKASALGTLLKPVGPDALNQLMLEVEKKYISELF